MAAFRGKNLRSGDLAEQLGVLLLQNVALVAPIPRTEDVGVDVVATLIRGFDGYKYIAEDSFFVQIKSSSVTEITFKDAQVEWLSQLELPFFIASVTRKTSTIHLYTTHFLSDILITNPDRKEIIFDLTSNGDNDSSDETASIRVPIGPPVISWSLETLASSADFLHDFFEILKSHVTLAKKAIETRRVGVGEMIVWETGKQPRVWGTKVKTSQGTEKTDEVIAPYLNALLQQLTMGENLSMTRSIYRLLEKTLDQKGHFTTVDGLKQLIPFNADIIKKKESGH